jgi:hypothetical protein
MFNSQILAGSSGQGGGFYPVTIDDSLRFEDGSSAYLSRTPAVAGNQKTWTFSCWFKRGNLGLTYPTIFATNDIDPGQYTSIIFYTETLYLNASGFGANYTLITNQVFRDVSGWYHLVWSVDTTQATSTDRMKLYINGEQVTSFSTATYPSLNKDLDVNATTLHAIGYFPDYGRYWDGYLSDIYLIDGQALDPTDFGETKDGVWIPKSYSGSYGTNGFHLEFNGNSNDSSGNGNNWTATNISAHDYVPDSPTNNFATMNSIAKKSTVTLSEGNLKSFSNDASIVANVEATFGISSGKWYFEASGRSGSNVGYPVIYLADATTRSFNNTNYTGNGCSAYGAPIVNGSLLTRVASLSLDSTSDVRQFAFDFDDGKMWIGKNGTWYDNSGTSFTNSTGPESGNNFNSNSGFTYDVGKLFSGHNDGNCAITFNFGQDSTFAGATTAGGNTDGNGKGDFQHPVPSGFLALCSANLPDSAIGPGQTALAEDYFVPYLYTADNTSPKSRTGMGFSPDFLWFKDRTTAFSNGLYDTVRGPNKQLQTNNTSAENTYTLLPSFDADGFTTQTDGTAGNVLNYTTDNYVTWAWKAGGTPTATNTAGVGAVPTSGSVMIDGVASTSSLAGTIAANKISANTAAGFSIINYTGNGLSGQTVAHALSSTP